MKKRELRKLIREELLKEEQEVLTVQRFKDAIEDDGLEHVLIQYYGLDDFKTIPDKKIRTLVLNAYDAITKLHKVMDKIKPSF